MKKTIEITVFEKKAKSKDGRQFSIYLTKLPGDTDTARVKFREYSTPPKTFPVNIELTQKECSFVEREYAQEVDGDLVKRKERTLWVGNWSLSDNEYRDNSMDKYFE